MSAEEQRAEWEAFCAGEVAKGRCPHSGMTIPACKRSLCDCFEFPEFEP